MQTTLETKKRPQHLMVGCEGALWDTRRNQWHKGAPLRPVFEKTFTRINTAAELKATLRAGAYAWPGGYPLYFITSDGAALSYNTVRAELRSVLDSIKTPYNDGWRVVAVDINYDENDLYDAHTDEKIPSAYGEDEE